MCKQAKTALFWLLQCVWGAPQTLTGALLWAVLALRRRRWGCYRSAVVVRWGLATSVSLGAFLFVNEQAKGETARRLTTHEYGHSLQSLALGPLYLPVVLLPSMLWCGLPAAAAHRRDTGQSYYTFYTERWANAWAARVTKEETPDW